MTLHGDIGLWGFQKTISVNSGLVHAFGHVLHIWVDLEEFFMFLHLSNGA